MANLDLLIKAPWGVSTSLSILSIQLREFIIKLSSIFIQSSFEWYSIVVTISFLSGQPPYNHSSLFMIPTQYSFTQPNYWCFTSYLSLFSSWSWYQFRLFKFWCFLKSLLFSLFSKEISNTFQGSCLLKITFVIPTISPLLSFKKYMFWKHFLIHYHFFTKRQEIDF